MCQNGEILIDLVGIILILTTKGNTDTQEIGLLKTLCKVVEEIIDTHLRSIISFHDVLCAFCAGRGTGMTILELKLSQDMVSVDKDPLLLVFLDL